VEEMKLYLYFIEKSFHKLKTQIEKPNKILTEENVMFYLINTIHWIAIFCEVLEIKEGDSLYFKYQAVKGIDNCSKHRGLLSFQRMTHGVDFSNYDFSDTEFGIECVWKNIKLPLRSNNSNDEFQSDCYKREFSNRKVLETIVEIISCLKLIACNKNSH